MKKRIMKALIVEIRGTSLINKLNRSKKAISVPKQHIFSFICTHVRFEAANYVSNYNGKKWQVKHR